MNILELLSEFQGEITIRYETFFNWRATVSVCGVEKEFKGVKGDPLEKCLELLVKETYGELFGRETTKDKERVDAKSESTEDPPGE